MCDATEGGKRPLVVVVDDQETVFSLARMECRGLPVDIECVQVGDRYQGAAWSDPASVIAGALRQGREVIVAFDANVYDEQGRRVNSEVLVRRLELFGFPGRVIAFIVWSDDAAAATNVLSTVRSIGVKNGEIVGKGMSHLWALKRRLAELLAQRVI